MANKCDDPLIHNYMVCSECVEPVAKISQTRHDVTGSSSAYTRMASTVTEILTSFRQDLGRQTRLQPEAWGNVLQNL